MSYDDMSGIDYTPNVWWLNLIAVLVAPFFLAYVYVGSAIQNYRERKELPVWVWMLGLTGWNLLFIAFYLGLIVLGRWMA